MDESASSKWINKLLIKILDPISRYATEQKRISLSLIKFKNCILTKKTNEHSFDAALSRTIMVSA